MAEDDCASVQLGLPQTADAALPGRTSGDALASATVLDAEALQRLTADLQDEIALLLLQETQKTAAVIA